MLKYRILNYFRYTLIIIEKVNSLVVTDRVAECDMIAISKHMAINTGMMEEKVFVFYLFCSPKFNIQSNHITRLFPH